MNKKEVKIPILFSLIALFLVFSFVFGQERKLEVEYPEIFGLKKETIKTDLPEYARYIFNFSIAIVGLILFGNLIWAGFLYLTSAGQPEKIKEAKERTTSAFLGAILLLSGYIVLTTINPELAIFKLPLLEKIASPAYHPPEYKPEEMTQIFWEIPIGQMLENGLWEKERTNKLRALLISFEQFLQQEIKTGDQSSNKISDLNKYLKNLTESCHCEKLTGICQKPENFSWPVGCSGDPCQEVREKINNVLKINEKKSKELLAFKEKLIEIKNTFEEEGRKFRNLEDIWAKCKQKGLLTRAEYYESVASIEEQGGKTKLERLYLPTKDDPLVFYCNTGGTIFDYPYTPEEISPGELEIAEEFVAEPTAGEPLSCPVVIPIGEQMIDQISTISWETNTGLEDLIFYIDKILAALTKMTELVSQCNESRCNVNCSCLLNPCFKNCAPLPNPCLPFCKSPCLQAVGGCYGDPCPRQKITETSERIKIYEDEIFNILDWIKRDIEDAQLLLETKEKDKIDLKTIRATTQTCLSLGAKTTITEKPEEEPFWMLLRCEMAIGNKGPDGNIITYCHPQNFYCCTNKPSVAPPEIVSEVAKEKPSVYTPLPEGNYSPSTSGFNNVPYFNQHDERWRSKSFGPCKPPSTISSSGCGPTSLAMILNFFGVKIDPPTMADWVVKKGYRVCGSGISTATCCPAIKALGEEKGLKCENLPGNVKVVLDRLKSGKDKVAAVSGRGAPPFTEQGHYIVLTGIETIYGEDFVHYNDPNLSKRRNRPATDKRPINFFIERGINAGCVVHK